MKKFDSGMNEDLAELLAYNLKKRVIRHVTGTGWKLETAPRVADISVDLMLRPMGTEVSLPCGTATRPAAYRC